MPKYHISPATGNPQLCTAKEGACPWGDAHFDNADLARMHYEMKNASIPESARKNAITITSSPNQVTDNLWGLPAKGQTAFRAQGDTISMGSAEYRNYSKSITDAMEAVRPGSVLTLTDGRKFIKSNVTGFSDSSWKVDRDSHFFDRELRLEAGKTYNGHQIVSAIIAIGGTIQE